MLIIDGHEDLGIAYTAMGRDFRESAALTRAREGASPPQGHCTLGLPDALSAGVGLIFATLFTAPAQKGRHSRYGNYHTPDEAHALALAQRAYYDELATHPQLALVRSRAELAAVKATWKTPTPTLGLVLLMENADPIRTPEELPFWFDQGVRIVGPAWQATRYCGGTGAPGPLTPAGRKLMRELDAAGMLLDVSHLAEESFWQALELFGGTVLATHSNCRALLPGPLADRHLSDEMITAVLARRAVIGVVLFNLFLSSEWQEGFPKDDVGLDAVLRQIDHICSLAGNTQQVAIGTDFDGGFGSEAIPRELDTIGDLPRLADALSAAGYRDDEVAGIMGQNWLRLLERALP